MNSRAKPTAKRPKAKPLAAPPAQRRNRGRPRKPPPPPPPPILDLPSGAASSTTSYPDPAPADIEHLAASLAQAEASTGNATAPGQPAQPEPAPVDYLGECRDVVTFAYESLAPLYPKTGAVYTPEVRERIAAAAAPLAEKYGFTMGRLMGEWGAEFRFALVAIPLIVPTARALAEDRADRKAAEQGATGKPEGNELPADAPPPPNNAPGVPPMPVFNLPQS